MRVTTAFKRLLALPGVNVTHVEFATSVVIVTVALRRRRLVCPEHGVVTEGVPFARPGSRLTRDFEMLVAWLATKMDATAITKLTKISWRTVGRIIEHVVTDELDPTRLDGLFEIGVDEISWRKHHNYLTLVANHETGKVVWGGEGKNAATLDGFSSACCLVDRFGWRPSNLPWARATAMPSRVACGGGRLRTRRRWRGC